MSDISLSPFMRGVAQCRLNDKGRRITPPALKTSFRRDPREGYLPPKLNLAVTPK
jgi:hypothetical protein